EEVSDRHQQQGADQRGLEHAKNFVERAPLPLRPIQTYGSKAEGPQNARQRADDQSFTQRGQATRIRELFQRTKADRVRSSEFRGDGSGIEHHAHETEKLVMALEHPFRYRGPTRFGY